MTRVPGAAPDMEDSRDREAIRTCLLRYCRGMDRRDLELARSAYHEDSRDDHGAYVGPGRGLVDWADAYLAELFSHWHHYIMNTLIDLDGDAAHAETSYMMVARRHDPAAPLHQAGGRYVDRFERRGGRWAIAQRVVILEWAADQAHFERFSGVGVHGTTDRSDPSYSRPLTVLRPDGVAAGARGGGR